MFPLGISLKSEVYQNNIIELYMNLLSCSYSQTARCDCMPILITSTVANFSLSQVFSQHFTSILAAQESCFHARSALAKFECEFVGWHNNDYYYTDLNASTLVTSSNNTSSNNISCIAMGYPGIQLLQWQTLSGDVIPQAQYTTVIEDNSYSAKLVSTLFVESDEECRQVNGYKCFIKVYGSSNLMKQLSFDCSPGTVYILLKVLLYTLHVTSLSVIYR
jgi:hypothetical protein